jgi:uncharacterized ion transporter superfamily protein YfcC
MSKPSRFPDTLVLIFGLIILAQLLTYVLAPGKFIREPKPEDGTTYTEVAGRPLLRERLASTIDSRGLSDAAFAEILQISPRTVRKWKAGPPKPDRDTPTAEAGVHIEASVGAILEKWVADGAAPTEASIAEWKASVDGRKLLVPGSYRELPRKKQSWHAPLTKVFTAIPRGLTHKDAVEIIIFVFLIGGVISIMRASGAFDALIGAAIRAFGQRANLLIAGTIAMFAFGSGMIGMAEEYVPFIALLVTMSLALGLDAMVGISIVFVGYAVGYGCAPFNPFTVIIAQGIADLPPSSGVGYRFLLLFLFLIVGVHHVVRYARRIQTDPSKSLVADIDYSTGFDLPENVPLTGRRLAVLLAFATTVIVFVFGVSTWDWYLMELSSIFLALGVVVAIVGGISPNKAAKAFCVGAGELTTTALLIGFARTIQIVLDDGQVTDTVVNGIATGLGGMGEEVGAVGMLVVQTLCNFFIPSGSGQAYVTMPIMAPLATELGIEKQVAVLAYQFGDGFTNVITPTNAAFMGMLAMARVPYERWLRFAIPLMLKLYALAAIALVTAVWFGYS